MLQKKWVPVPQLLTKKKKFGQLIIHKNVYNTLFSTPGNNVYIDGMSMFTSHIEKKINDVKSFLFTVSYILKDKHRNKYINIFML